MTLDQIIADIDARGWCYEIDNFYPTTDEVSPGEWDTIRRSDVGINVYREGKPAPGRLLANVYGRESLADALRVAYELAVDAEE